MSVEVERKFLCTAETLKILDEIGEMVSEALLQHLMTLIAVVCTVTLLALAICLMLIMKFYYLYQPSICIGQCQFHDQYFDTPTFDLTLRDIWLRKREGCWELKCPVNRTQETSEQQSLCTRYKEITNLPEILLRLKEVIQDICEDGEESSPQVDKESWLSKMNLVCFAKFTTVRQSFSLEEDGVQIDLDQADFGYHVGEIEVLIPEEGDVQSALKKIERTAQKLGLTGDQQVEGKMDVYLKRHHPEHYAKLKSEHNT